MRSPSDFPRALLAHRPTPLEAMPNVTAMMSGPTLYVKRDDCTGLAMGGNKARQLEFYFGDALSQDANVVLTTGAVQSNFVRCTAAAAAKLGLRCEIQLEDRVAGMGEEYHQSGNVFLDRLFGAKLHDYPEGEDETGADRALDERAELLRARGDRPYVIHLSDRHPPLGALGYVEAAEEIMSQAAAMGLTVGAIVTASGSAATHAGVLVGLRASGVSRVAVQGICVRRDQEAQARRVLYCVRATEQLLDCGEVVRPDDVLVSDEYLGPGYGHPAPETTEAVLVAARREGLLLDPVYTGKAFAGLLHLARTGALPRDAATVFLHTGGAPALFGYHRMLEGELR